MDIIFILCIVATVLWFPVVGFLAWCLFKFSKHWNQLFFIKRRRLLTLSMILQYIIPMFIAVPVVIIFILSLRINPNSKATEKLRVAAFIALSTVMTPSFTIMQYIYIAQVWLLYYDMLLSKIQKNRQWRMIIDPKTSNKIDNESKFALKNQNTLYKTKPVLKICMIAFVIEYIIIGFPVTIILNMTSQGPILTFNGPGALFLMPYMTLTFFIRFCFGFYIWQKMNRLQMIDNFGIRKEIGYVCIVALLSILVFLCLSIVNTVITGLLGLIDDDLNDAIVRLTTCYFVLIVAIVHTYLNFIYPIKIYNKISNDKEQSTLQDGISARYNESIKHWTQIMQTEVGYEEFMDYLAKEFSTENLLFITEYIEVKKVLMDHFTHILDKLKNEHTRDCGFFVEFATLGSDEYKSLEARASLGVKTFSNGLGSLFSGNNIHVESPDDSVDFAQSSIARQLVQELFKLTTSNVEDRGADDHGYNKKNTIAVGDCIIRAFSCLYCKYVDDYGASFMINISHRNRQSLLKLFDYKYYQKWCNNSTDESVIKQDERELDPSIFIKLRNIASNEEKSNDNNNDTITKMAMANYLLRSEIVNNAGCNTKEEFETKIEYLLHLLMKDMEKAVKEVSNLMQDSFFRFRREKKHLFQYMIKSSSQAPNV